MAYSKNKKKLLQFLELEKTNQEIDKNVPKENDNNKTKKPNTK